ncbi:Spy/CpxP family protein refolding chaperone [Bradyrhizobium sp. SZCCHNR2026]|uniref:Spy/CpxP family protein refolding chaperone n=1 Tax=Bradyrhizobium sp. SZCCHNR2026 TaxID=3057381 RepID=UPI0029170F84|nr:Spy/CpxP family protein refolding chaperone [Bradyrhizobium sp. SZCCHNR2026]
MAHLRDRGRRQAERHPARTPRRIEGASAKAADIITKDCPTALPAKATDRLALAEQRLDAMQQAIKIVRPAFQAFYDSLDDKQKATLDASGPRHWGWHHWHWPWSED